MGSEVNLAFRFEKMLDHWASRAGNPSDAARMKLKTILQIETAG